MFVVHVFVHVKPGSEEAFKAATLENARNSIQEKGIARFDVVQQQDDPSRFVLVEVYRTEADAAKHKETAHYFAWRDAVADIMAEPRSQREVRRCLPRRRRVGLIMQPFEFATTDRIIFGADTSESIPQLAAGLGRRAFVALDQFAPSASPIVTALAAGGIDATVFRVSGEPSTDSVAEGVALARDGNCDLVIAVGGGSVIDTGKAVAALVTNGGEPLDYLEVVGSGQEPDGTLPACDRSPDDGGHRRGGHQECRAEGAG